MRFAKLAAICIGATAISARISAAGPSDCGFADWPSYGGDAGGGRYSPLAQIDRKDVAQLRVMWEYHTGDVSDGSGDRRQSEFEAAPFVVGGSMYVTPPFNRVVALDPEDGTEKWAFDPKIDLHAPY